MDMKDKQTTQIPPELVRRAQSGDREAFAELYQQTGATIYRTVCAMVRDEQTAWDIHQNTYLLAYRGLRKLEKPEAFLPWLRRIAVNETVKELTREQPLTFTELAGDWEEEPCFPETRDGYQPEIELDKKEAARLVREILDQLPQKQRLIVGMYYYEGCSIKEIAQALNVTQGTVKTQLHLGRKKVEVQVKRLEDEGIRLYGLSPMAFLLALLRAQEPPVPAGAKPFPAAPAKTAPVGGEAVTLTAKAVKTGFFHTVLGKVTAAILVAAVAADFVIGYLVLRNRRQAAVGDNRPSRIAAVSESLPLPSEEPDDTQPPEQIQSVFPGIFSAFDTSVLAAIYNAPFPDGSPTPTVVWNEAEQNRLVIYPRYAGSTVSARRIIRDADGNGAIEETPVYTTVCGEGDCIGAALERPEVPCWVITVQTPDGAEGSWVLTRNSQYGTPTYEYLTCGGDTGASSDPFSGSEFYGSIAEQQLRHTGYDSRVGNEYVYHLLPYNNSNPFVLLGESMLSAIVRALEPFGKDASSWMWNNWFADEGTVYMQMETEMEGDTCRMKAAVFFELYMDEMYAEDLNPRDRTMEETVAWQAERFSEERIIGAAGHLAEEGEEVYFNLQGLLVFNPTLSAKTVSITVNGADAGRYTLTEGDFYTWIPFDGPNLPGDKPVAVEVRVVDTYFGAPDRAILDLWPEMRSIFRGGR